MCLMKNVYRLGKIDAYSGDTFCIAVIFISVEEVYEYTALDDILSSAWKS